METIEPAHQAGKRMCLIPGHGSLVWEDCNWCGGTGTEEAWMTCKFCNGECGFLYCPACQAEEQEEAKEEAAQLH